MRVCARVRAHVRACELTKKPHLIKPDFSHRKIRLHTPFTSYTAMKTSHKGTMNVSTNHFKGGHAEKHLPHVIITAAME